jgi:hypothetical protein
MYMNCGCGKNEERHKPTDITLSDLTAAAKGPALTPISGSVGRRALLHPATLRVPIEERVVVSRAGAQ